MNVARKSTTKLPQNWPPPRPKEDEADSGLGSADSTEFPEAAKDSFQEVLFNIKALNGGTDSLDSDQPQKEDGNKNLPAALRQNGEKVSKECDILDQIDSLVNDSTSSGQGAQNGTAEGVSGAACAQSSGAEDEVKLISEHSTPEKGEKGLSKDVVSKEEQKEETKSKSDGDIASDERKNAVSKKKHPLQIGAKVRNTFHSIMSKLVQSGNPEVSSLITKTKSEDSQDSIASASGEPETSTIPVQQGKKGNLFDNLDLDISDKGSNSPKASPMDTKEDTAADKDVKSPKVALTSTVEDGELLVPVILHKFSVLLN